MGNLKKTTQPSQSCPNTVRNRYTLQQPKALASGRRQLNRLNNRPRSKHRAAQHKRPVSIPETASKAKKRTCPASALEEMNFMDTNYDGYYDDVPTEDSGQGSDELDPELIKRVALIAVGAIAFVILSVIVMSIL